MNASPAAQRGMILLEQRRYPEAEKYFRDALADEPNDPFALYYLALCQHNQDHHKEALETIGRALALEPEMGDFHALKAFILVDLRRPADALAASEEALRIEPDSDFALTARAAGFLSRQEWSSAELAARKALELNPDNPTAANQLAHALRLQNRLHESAEQTGYMLAQDPQSADNHSTAGWVALQRGDHRQAEQHFLEALRLAPEAEYARAGLKESFKARSPVYRWYLRYCFFMQRFTAGKQWMLVLGLFFGVRFVQQVLPGPAALGVSVAYLLFVLWVHVASAVGNFQLLFDRFARHALSAGEKWEACFVGGGVLAGLPLLALGILAHMPIPLIVGLSLIGGAFPFAYVFNNQETAGRYLFFAAGLFVYVTGAINLVMALRGGAQNPGQETLTMLAFLTVIAVTWLANVRSLNRRR